MQRATTCQAYMPQEFQSSLELSPECNVPTRFDRKSLPEVSILTRAFARVQHGISIRIVSREFVVSILTRAFARVQPMNNIPNKSENVSILTRAFARVQPATGVFQAVSLPSFNPHSSFRPSATRYFQDYLH